jgi:hypothetical protein
VPLDGDDVVATVDQYGDNEIGVASPRLKDALLYGVQQQPDVEAEVRKYSRSLGVPLPTARDTLKDLQPFGRAEALDPNGMQRRAPRTARWLENPDNAAIAHDDTPQLFGIENLLAGIGERGLQVGGSFLGGLGRLADSPADWLERRISLGKIVVDAKGIRWEPTQEADFAKPAGGFEALDKAAADVKLGYTPGTTWEEVKQQPLAKFLPFALEQGIVSLPDMVAAVANLPSYVIARSDEIGQKRKENDGGKAQDATVGDLLLAMPAAAASAWLERFATRGIIGLDDGVKAFKEVPGAVGKATAKEAGTEAAQEGLDSAGESVGTKAGFDPGATLDRMMAGAVGGAGFGGAVRAATAPLQAAVESHQRKLDVAAEAERQGQMIDGLAKLAEASKLRERDPESFEAFVNEAAEYGPVESVFIDAKDLSQVLAQSPDAVTMTQILETLPSVQDQLEEALSVGGVVEIPVGEFAAKIAGTELGQTILPFLKTDPAAMSRAEAEEFMQTQAEDFKATVAKLVETDGDADAFQASAEAVHTNIKSQLDTVNRFTPDVNDAYATFVASFYSTQAARFGVTPEQLFEQYPVAIQAQGVAEGSLIDQSASAKPIEVFGEGDNTVHVFDAAELEAERKAAPPAPEGDALEQSDWETNLRKGRELQGLRAAFKDEVTGKVYVGYSHQAILNNIPLDDTTSAYSRLSDDWDQARPNVGFVTSEGEFVSRDDAEKRWNVLTMEDAKDFLRSRKLYQDAPGAHWSYEPGLGFQSTLFNWVMEKGQARASADQWLASLRNAPGIKKEELEWIGLPEALTMMGAEGPVTREQVLAYIAQNGVRLDEVVLGEDPSEEDIEARAEELEREAIEGNHFEPPYYVGEVDSVDDDGDPTTKYIIASQYGRTDSDLYDTEEEAQEAADEMNGEAESEWLSEQGFYSIAESELREKGGTAKWAEYQAVKGGENYRELLLILPTKTDWYDGEDKNPRKGNPRLTRSFTAAMGHWDHDNVLAHTRLADFQTPDGKRVLLVQEVQSDWHQKGRDKGYAVPAPPEEVAAAEQAFTAAIDVRNGLGIELQTRLQPLLQARIEELEAQREANFQATEAIQRQREDLAKVIPPGGVVSVAGRWAGPPELADQYAALTQQWNDGQARGAKISDLINAAKYQAAMIAAGKNEPYVETLRALHYTVKVGQFWRSSETALSEEYAEVVQLTDDLVNARLKAEEADQRLKQARGEGGIPDAPFKATWPALVMKRLLRMAVEEGYDALAWATGEQQADLYDMREHIEEIEAWPATDMPDDTRIAVDFPRQMNLTRRVAENGVGEWSAEYNALFLTREQAISLMGQELGARVYDRTMADRVMREDGYFEKKLAETFTGADLTVGGEGHKAFYNRNLVNITNDIVKKFGAKVGVLEIAVEPSSTGYTAQSLRANIADLERIAAELPPQEELEATTPVAEWKAQMADIMAERDQLNIEERRAQYGSPEHTAVVERLTANSQRRDALAAVANPAYGRLNTRKRLEELKGLLAEYTGKQWGFQITEQMRTAQDAVQPKLFQGDGTPRGTFNPQTSTITLLKNADLSTFLHESGHFFLETLARMAADEAAPQEIKDDWEKASRFIGFGGSDPAAWLGIPVEGRREGHETWARGFEAYLREGKPPAAQLKGVFQRF